MTVPTFCPLKIKRPHYYKKTKKLNCYKGFSTLTLPSPVPGVGGHVELRD